MKFLTKLFPLLFLLFSGCDNLFKPKTNITVVFILEIVPQTYSSPDLETVKQILMRRILNVYDEKNIHFEIAGKEIRLSINHYDSTSYPLSSLRKLITIQGNLEFWETYENQDLIMKLVEADKHLSEILDFSKDTTAQDTTGSKQLAVGKDSLANKQLTNSDSAKPDTSKKDIFSRLGLGEKDSEISTEVKNAQEDISAMAKAKRENPLFFYLQPLIDDKGQAVEGPVVGRALLKDTARVMSYLNNEKIKRVLPDNVKFAWTYKPVKGAESVTELIALKVTRRDKKAALSGDIITDARKEYDQMQGGCPSISMSMTDEAAQTWSALTGDNIGKSIAIVLDDYVYSYPTVGGKISFGSAQISGDFTSHEADYLVNILKAGILPVQVKLINETFIRPAK